MGPARGSLTLVHTQRSSQSCGGRRARRRWRRGLPLRSPLAQAQARRAHPARTRPAGGGYTAAGARRARCRPQATQKRGATVANGLAARLTFASSRPARRCSVRDEADGRPAAVPLATAGQPNKDHRRMQQAHRQLGREYGNHRSVQPVRPRVIPSRLLRPVLRPVLGTLRLSRRRHAAGAAAATLADPGPQAGCRAAEEEESEQPPVPHCGRGRGSQTEGKGPAVGSEDRQLRCSPTDCKHEQAISSRKCSATCNPSAWPRRRVLARRRMRNTASSTRQSRPCMKHEAAYL